LRTARSTSCAVWAIHSSATTRDALRRARLAEVPQVGVSDQRLFDEGAHLGVPTLGQQVRPIDGFVGHRTLRQGKGPLAEPVLRAGNADRRHLKPLLDRFSRRNRVVGDRRAEHREATLVDQFTVRVDDRLRRALGQSLYLPEDDLHRPIDHSLLHAFVEHQLEGLEKIVPLLLRESVWKPEVAEVTKLDRLCCALVGHVGFPHAS
jgi:hypothetical protein